MMNLHEEIKYALLNLQVAASEFEFDGPDELVKNFRARVIAMANSEHNDWWGHGKNMALTKENLLHFLNKISKQASELRETTRRYKENSHEQNRNHG